MKTSKAPSGGELLQFQKSQRSRLVSPLVTNSPHMVSFLAANTSKSTMANMSALLNQTEQRINFLRTNPLQYTHSSKQYEIEKIRDQTNRLSIEKAKLLIERDRLEKQEQRQKLKLEQVLQQLERVQNQSSSNTMNNEQKIVNRQQTKFPSIQNLLQQLPQGVKHKYAEKVSTLDPKLQAMSLFTLLSTRTMQTDRAISFLMREKSKQESEIQYLINQNNIPLKPTVQETESIQVLKKNEEQSYKQLMILQTELQQMQSELYVERQLKTRIKLQEDLYETTRKRKHMTLLKLWKLIQLSGNHNAIREAERIFAISKIAK